MYIMSLGNKPIGECYFYTKKDGTARIVAHYYSGGDKELIKLTPMLNTPEEESPIKRLDDLEEYQECMTKYVEHFFEEFCKQTGVEYKTYEQYKAETMPPPTPQEPSDGGGGNGDKPFMVANIETFSPTRGQ